MRLATPAHRRESRSLVGLRPCQDRFRLSVRRPPRNRRVAKPSRQGQSDRPVATLFTPHLSCGAASWRALTGALEVPLARNFCGASSWQPDDLQSSAISASRMTAASRPPNVEENTVMPAKSYSGGASFISSCIVPVRLVASSR